MNLRMFLIIFSLLACSDGKADHVIKLGADADYPPFEFYQNGIMKGFDIDLGQLIGQEMGKEAVFEQLQFGTILLSLDNGSIDAGISTITITPERQKNFDFSDPYYNESLAVVFVKDKPISDKSQLVGKKVACQLGTTMEIWLKKHMSTAEVMTFDTNNQAIEALKASHVEVVLVDGWQGALFSQKNPSLSSTVIAKSDTGYGIAFKRGSPLKDQVNRALKSLIAKGKIKELEQKWLNEK